MPGLVQRDALDADSGLESPSVESVRERTGGTRTLAAETGCLVLADISGYTGYVVESPLAHAEDVVSDLADVVAGRLGRLFRVNKREGDAVFAFALAGEMDGSTLLDALDECYLSFHGRIEGIGHATSCSCAACSKLPELDLKFAVHAGEFIRRPGAGGGSRGGSWPPSTPSSPTCSSPASPCSSRSTSWRSRPSTRACRSRIDVGAQRRHEAQMVHLA